MVPDQTYFIAEAVENREPLEFFLVSQRNTDLPTVLIIRVQFKIGLRYPAVYHHKTIILAVFLFSSNRFDLLNKYERVFGKSHIAYGIRIDKDSTDCDHNRRQIFKISLRALIISNTFPYS